MLCSSACNRVHLFWKNVDVLYKKQMCNMYELPANHGSNYECLTHYYRNKDDEVEIVLDVIVQWQGFIAVNKLSPRE